ncbi:MAG: hypothetical protein WKF58_19695 [Ilumatobacteraceae bacterium]
MARSRCGSPEREALLRLEFVLALRKVSLPSNRCRAVLLALSAGDGRRVDRLDGEQHLEGCDTCRALAEPVSERKRSLAGWLILPAVEAVRRAATSIVSSKPARALRSNHAAQLGAAAPPSWRALWPPSSSSRRTAIPRRSPSVLLSPRRRHVRRSRLRWRNRQRRRVREIGVPNRSSSMRRRATRSGARSPAQVSSCTTYRRTRGSGPGCEAVGASCGCGSSVRENHPSTSSIVHASSSLARSRRLRARRALGLDADGLDRVERRGYYLEVRFTDIRPRERRHRAAATALRALRWSTARPRGRRWTDVDQLMLVAAAPLGLSPLSRDQVSCRSRSHRESTCRGRVALTAINRLSVSCTTSSTACGSWRLRSDDAPEHRGELNDVGVVGNPAGGSSLDRSFTLVLQKSSDPASCRPEHRVYLVRETVPTLQRTLVLHHRRHPTGITQRRNPVMNKVKHFTAVAILAGAIAAPALPALDPPPAPRDRCSQAGS